MAENAPRLTTLNDANRDAWNDFVDRAPAATFFHRAEWAGVFRDALGHRCHYLALERDGRVAGVMPLVHMRSRLFGNALLSLPFLAYGGAVAGSPEDAALLEARALELARELDVDYLELRHRERHDGPELTKDNYVTFRKEIPADPDACMAAIPRKQRAMVRKGIKKGLAGEIDRDTRRFYDVFSESYRNLGTPVLSPRYFAAIKSAFGDDCEVMTVTHEGAPVAGVMSFYFRNEVIPYYGGGRAAARDLYANDFMYWDLMRRAAENGLEVFDYGRSRVGTGSYRFKKHWGFEPEPLYYQYHLVGMPELPDVSPGNRKYQLMIAAWKRMPVWVSRLVGPVIARTLPG